MFCTACGTRLSESPSTSVETDRNASPSDDETQTNTDDGAKYIRRFAAINGVQAVVWLIFFGWSLRTSVMMTATGSEHATLYQLQSVGPFYTIFGLIFLVGFSAATVGVLQRKRLFWYLGVAVNAIILLLALVPQQVWVLIFATSLGLYWAYRSYEPIRTLPETDLLETVAPEPSSISSSTGALNSAAADSRPYQVNETGSIVGSTVWMGVISLLLFWLPALGPLIAGYVGGKKAGSASRGALAAILPAGIVGLIIWALVSAANLPFIGAILGGAAMILVVLHSLGLLAGALIGGTLAPSYAKHTPQDPSQP